jgi:hypothetical protein
MRKIFNRPTSVFQLPSLLLFFFLYLSACGNKTFNSEQELWEYIKNPDHGYLHKKNINGYDFSLLYKPTDLLVKQELSNELDTMQRAQQIKQLREKYGQYLYFSLSMSRNGKELLSTTPNNRQEFGAMVNELAFGMREKVHVFTPNKDTLELLDYNYPRMYGMSQSTTMLFVYPRDENYLLEKTLNLSVQDLGTYTGEVTFKVETKKINNEPKIKFKDD